MGKGNDCHVIQAPRSAGVIADGGEKDFSDNRRLLTLVREGTEREAEEATEQLLQRNAGLVRSIALRFQILQKTKHQRT